MSFANTSPECIRQPYLLFSKYFLSSSAMFSAEPEGKTLSHSLSLVCAFLGARCLGEKTIVFDNSVRSMDKNCKKDFALEAPDADIRFSSELQQVQ